MTDTLTDRLVLHPIDTDEADRILTGSPTTEENWADDYPFEGDLEAVTVFADLSHRKGEQRPWGYYQIRRFSDSQAIGGIGFFGPPDEHGRIEVGYGLVASARGHRFAAEALAAIAVLAFGEGARLLVAETTSDNLASQHVMARAGMVLSRTDGVTLRYELEPA